MQLLLAFILAQGAAPPLSLESDEEAGKPKVLVLDLVNSTELKPGQVEALQDAILGGLSGAPVEIMGAADIAKLLEVQQGNVTLGCLRDDCLFDLAKAWQARYVISGSLAMVAERAILNLKLLDAGADVPKVLHRESHEAEPRALTALIRVTAANMRQALGGPPPTEKELEVLKVAKVPVLGLSLGAVGVLTGLVGGYFHMQAIGAANEALEYEQDPLVVDHFLLQMNAQRANRNISLLTMTVLTAASAYAWRQRW